MRSRSWLLSGVAASLLGHAALASPHEAVVDQVGQPWHVSASRNPATGQSARRRLVEGLECDVQLYTDFLATDEGQNISITTTLCESRIVYLKTSLAGTYGPVQQADLYAAMCSYECLRSDELHQLAMTTSRCSCAELSSDAFVTHDFCLENSARMLCTHLGECGHWGCALEDFMCQRNEWDRLYPCAASPLVHSALTALVAIAAAMLLL